MFVFVEVVADVGIGDEDNDEEVLLLFGVDGFNVDGTWLWFDWIDRESESLNIY